MGKMHPAVVLVLQVGAVAAALVSIGALVERYWSPIKRWLQDALTNPVLKKMDEIDTNLRARDDKLAEDIKEIRDSFDDHRTYVGAHLGPAVDATNPPLYERVGHLEAQVSDLSGEETLDQ